MLARREGRPTGTSSSQYDFGFDYRTFDFDSPGTESFATFGRSFDLFGDGSVHAVFTPGHTHGHTSYVLRLRDREVLIAGDAIYTMRTLEESVLPYRMADEHHFRRSLKEIQRYRERTPGALIIPGHDWDSFSALDPVVRVAASAAWPAARRAARAAAIAFLRPSASRSLP